MIRLLLMLAVATSFLYGAKEGKTEALKVRHLKDGTMLVRVALNYENTNELSRRLRGFDGMLSVNLPIPGNWNVLSVEGYLSYSPSILLLKNHSSGVINFNNVNIKQFKLFDNMDTGVKYSIKPKYIKDYNELRIEMIQHYTDECESNSNSQLWTDINLAESYIEYHIEKTPIPEEIQSLTTHMMDPKQYELEPLNYIVSSNPSDEELKHYALLTGAAANAIKYKMTPISVSNKVNLKKHNILITTKDRAKKKLQALKYKYIFDNDPLVSLKFNDDKFEPISTQNIKVQVSKSGLYISEKRAFFDKSLYMSGKGKMALNDLDLESNENTTVSFWFKPDNSTQRSVLFGFEDYKLVLDKKSIGFTTNSRDLYGSKIKSLRSSWHHIVANFSKKTMRANAIYLDGRAIKLRQLKGKSRAKEFSSFAFIGGRSEDNLRNYKGLIDQFYIFEKKLSSKFIRKFYKIAKRNKKRTYDESLFISEKISYDINVLRNPKSPEKAILVIAPQNKEKILNVLYGLYKQDLSFYFRAGLDINGVDIPPRAPAYSAKDYIPVDTKIYFSDLGYKTEVLRGWYPPSISIGFNVYPDHHFDDKDRIETTLNYVFPTTVNDDSVANIFLNGKFAKQIKVMDAVEAESLSLKTGGLLDVGGEQQLPAFLLNKGHNKLKFNFSLVPEKNGHCSINNNQNLLVMIMDNSYFTLPKSKRWIEMPYMQYIHMSAYPYSIYPDLQDTQLVLANNDNQTIAASMNFMFFLAQEIQSYPYYLEITQDMQKLDEEKHLILFGTIYDESMQEFSKYGPISFTQTQIDKPYPFIKRFVKHKSIADDDRLKKYRFISKMQETNKLDENLLVEMFKSPLNDEKTALMFVAEKAKDLNHGVKSILSFENRHLLNGDTLIYNAKLEAGISFDVADKYVLSSMNWFDKASLLIGMNPWLYISALVFFVLVVAWVARDLLADFKKRNHKHVE